MGNHSSAIVKVDWRNYRRIAQENWGLTNKQMKGMHVHHRVPRSLGGTNDPSNLYVCSPWFHEVIWHGKEGGFIGLAQQGGIKGGKVQGPRNRESGQMKRIQKLGTAVSAERGKHLKKNKPPQPRKLTKQEVGQITAERNKTLKMREASRRARLAEAAEGKHPAQIRCCCLICQTETNLTGMTRFHKHIN